MGGSTSAAVPAPAPLPENVQDLIDQGVCKVCIQRLLSLNRQQMANVKTTCDENCAACSGIIGSIDRLKDNARKCLGRYRFHDIQVEIPGPILAKDCDFCTRLNCPSSCSMKNYIKAQIMISLPRAQQGPLLHVQINDKDTFNCELRWPTLYITGRYFKEARRVSHSRFMPGNPVSSVEGELIEHLSGIVECSEIKFQSAGREDMDVRMIGSGRPFCLTLVNPLPDESLPPPTSKDSFAASFAEKLPSEITCNYGVSARNLEISWRIPEVEPKHVKCYRCVVYCRCPVTQEMLNKLDDVHDLTINQRTPCRVSHRREMMFREKTIISLSYELVNEHYFILDLKTSSGTYIKEFVNSDFGRTIPCLSDLLNPDFPMGCELMQLDVVYVGE